MYKYYREQCCTELQPQVSYGFSQKVWEVHNKITEAWKIGKQDNTFGIIVKVILNHYTKADGNQTVLYKNHCTMKYRSRLHNSTTTLQSVRFNPFSFNSEIHAVFLDLENLLQQCHYGIFSMQKVLSNLEIPGTTFKASCNVQSNFVKQAPFEKPESGCLKKYLLNTS